MGLAVTQHDAQHNTPAAAFYFDLGDPWSYLAAERVLSLMPIATEWIPVLARELVTGEPAHRCEQEQLAVREDVERIAAARGLQPLRWPQPFPFDSEAAMLAATYARQIGRTVPFVLAAFRQAFAGGRALDAPDNVVIAGAACEMHPAALLKGSATKGTRSALAAATTLAAQRGVRSVPAVWAPAGAVFHGDAELEQAASALEPTA